MKKIILAIALFAAVSANAQSDSFFRYSNVEEQRTNSGNGEWGTMPTLVGHGYTTDMDANAPLGSGLLLLAGMGLAYGFRKKN
jgi:hypothetical protein